MVKLASQTVAKFTLGADWRHFAGVDAPLHPLAVQIAQLLALSRKVGARGAWYQALPFGGPARLRRVQAVVYAGLQAAVDAAPRSDASAKSLPLAEVALRASCVADYLASAVDECGERFPTPLLLANMFVMTAAGFTTSSILLAWLLYGLVMYPDAQDRLVRELADAGYSPDMDWTPEFVHGRLQFLDRFVKETQRLRNPSFQPACIARTVVVWPGGYWLSVGACLISSINSVHCNSVVLL